MKKLLSLILALLLLTVLAVPAMAASDVPYVVDEADLLTDSEERALEDTLSALSEKLGMDVVVVTTDDTGYKSSVAYADDFFDYGGYGADGILWLIDMDNRKSTISTAGEAIDLFDDSVQDTMQDELAPMLTDGRYYEAACRFAELCDEYSSFSVGTSLIIAVVIGFVVAFIATAVMKGQLKSVRAKAAAADYVKPGSLQVTEARDLFLYRHVDRREKPKSNGSSTHTSSSGRSHGGSSRSF